MGESGCGKSTTARLLMHLIRADAGRVTFDGALVNADDAAGLREVRRQMQMVFQDSYSSLNPRLPIEETIMFGPKVHGVSAAAARERARELFALVGLDPAQFIRRYPHELSGGQRQRVNIARALALEPRLLILDEAVSALDKSVEAQVLNLLLALRRELGLTYIFISHDLNVVQYMSDRVLVMYLGKVVEIGSTADIYERDAASLHRGAPLRHALHGPRPADGGAAPHRRPAEPHQPPARLPVPYEVPVCRRGLPARRAAPRSGTRGGRSERSGRLWGPGCPSFRRLPHAGGGLRAWRGAGLIGG